MELDLSTLEEMVPQDLEAPICSTDQIWREDDMSRSLTSDLNSIETMLSTCIKSANTQLTATVSNGTFSVTPELDLLDNSRYLVNLQYSTSSGLVGRSLYALKVNKSSVLQQTITLSEPKNGTDNLMVIYRNGAFTFSTSYTGGSPTNVTINVI